MQVCYRICGLFGGDFNLANLVKITKLTVFHYQTVYTARMGYSTEICQF